MRISDCYRSFHKCGHFLGFQLTFERNRQISFWSDGRNEFCGNKNCLGHSGVFTKLSSHFDVV